MHIGALTGVACIHDVLHMHRSSEIIRAKNRLSNRRASTTPILHVRARPARAHCPATRTACARAALRRTHRFAAEIAQEMDVQAARGDGEELEAVRGGAGAVGWVRRWRR